MLSTKYPCISGLNASDCCHRFIDGAHKPQTAEQLMRSRYTAYTLNDHHYLNRTRHADFCAAESPAMLAEQTQKTDWKQLQIIDAPVSSTDDEYAEVEFKAWYQQAGQWLVLHERSRFVCVAGQWLYTDGDSTTLLQKIARNDPCPCASGKKYKKCCG